MSRIYDVKLRLTTDNIPSDIDDSEVMRILQRDIQNHIMSLHSIVKEARFNKYVNRDSITFKVIESNGEPPF